MYILYYNTIIKMLFSNKKSDIFKETYSNKKVMFQVHSQAIFYIFKYSG